MISETIMNSTKDELLAVYHELDVSLCEIKELYKPYEGRSCDDMTEEETRKVMELTLIAQSIRIAQMDIITVLMCKHGAVII